MRQGLLYDILGRRGHHDMREVTVEQFARRYVIDARHADRVAQIALQWFDELTPRKAKNESTRQLLAWACKLHEIGLSISHNGHHKHAAYILGKSDMPGFSKREQALLSDWVLAHNGKLTKVSHLAETTDHWLPPMCLRLATLFLRRRHVEELPEIHLSRQGKKFQVVINKQWLEEHPLTEFSLDSEIEQWKKLGLDLSIKPI